MKRRRLLWKIFSTFLWTTLALLLVVSWFASAAFRTFHFEQIVDELENNALILRPKLIDIFQSGQLDAIDSLCKQYELHNQTRITVIDRAGLVLGDSQADIGLMDLHSDRDEIRDAYQGELGTSQRFSATLRRQMVYVAVPIRIEGQVTAVVRFARPVSQIDSALNTLQIKIAVAWLITGILATLIIFNFAMRLTKPFHLFKENVRTFIDKDFKGTLPPSQSEEISKLTEEINFMAEQLRLGKRTIDRQQNEVEAILSSMNDAVLAVDSHNRILNMNAAAASLFRINLKDSRKALVQETIRNSSFNDFVSRALISRESISEEITFYDAVPEYLRTTGTRLLDSEGKVVGVVIVLNNVTRYKKLENLRREFVANVSHELRTPITSIKGFVETLQAGAVEDPEDAERFLGIIERHVDRLNNIIEDLLSLSKIEQEQEEIGLKLEQNPLFQALNYAIQICDERALEKNISIQLDCAPDIEAYLHDNLFVQAITNLLDNAIKYSHQDAQILVRGFLVENQVAIEVQDFGSGISEVHQERLFERFYRVDRSRGRDQGGTGLGLSIVKHIVVAHRGEISVKSQLDEGSTFRILLPRPETESADTLADSRDDATMATPI